MIGELLAGRFRVVGPPIGEGASGVVHPAVDEHTGRPVAIKMLHEHLVGDPAALARLEAEAGIAGRLSHRRVVEVLGLWSDAGRWMLVTQRVDGCSLDQVQGPLAPEAAIALGIQVCDALVAAHDAGLVHGDLRPGNVLVGPAGASVFDFGVASSARIAATGAGADLPVRPGETAPELQGGAPPVPATDLYGLGVVLHRALTGELPYRGPSPFAVLAAQQEAPPPLPPGPSGLAQLVVDLLQPDPVRRPSDAAAVGDALRRLQRNPLRRVRAARRWIAPVRPLRAWLVHGVDPATGGRAIVRAELGKGRALELAERLRAEGWQVGVAKEALSVADLVWVAILAVLSGVAVPILGAVVGAAIGLKWRSAGVQPRLREVLPIVRAPLPPRSAPAGAEYVVATGLALLATALLLWIEPWLALVPLVALAAILRAAWNSRAPDEEQVALHGRIATVFADARAAIEGRAHGLDRALALQGELEALERGWRAGQLEDRDVLLRAEALHVRAGSAARREEAATARTLEALRRTGTKVEP